MDVGERIRLLREKAGFSQNELAGRERPQAQKKDFGALFGAFLEDGSADLIDSLRTVAQKGEKNG